MYRDLQYELQKYGEVYNMKVLCPHPIMRRSCRPRACYLLLVYVIWFRGLMEPCLAPFCFELPGLFGKIVLLLLALGFLTDALLVCPVLT